MADLDSIKRCLESGSEVCESLQDLNVLLSANPSPAYVSEVLVKLPLPLLFQCLQSRDAQQVQQTCSVLDKVLSCLPASDLVQYKQWVELGLQYSVGGIKKTCLQALRSHLTDDGVRSMLLTPTMFHLVSMVIGDDSLECAAPASDLILQFTISPRQLDTSLREAWLIDMRGLMLKNATVCYRVYELAAQSMIRGNSEAGAFIRSSNLLQELVGELEVDDILVKMNCIELLITLLDSIEGCKFLRECHVITKVHSLLKSSQQDPLGGIIVPSIIKFFGHMTLSEGVEFVSLSSDYPDVVELILESVQPAAEQTSAVWGIAMDTFGLLSSSDAGRKILHKFEALTQGVLKCIGNCIGNSPSLIRTRALRALAMLVGCQETTSGWEESQSRVWFRAMHTDTMSSIMSVVKQPFVDIRVAGLKVLVAMATYEWGQREMSDQPAFLEYLLDRHSEPDKSGKEFKYEIVHKMVLSGEGVWSPEDFLKLRKYDREGPFHYQADTTVAIEGSS